MCQGDWMEVSKLSAHRYSGSSRPNQHGLVSAENDPIWLCWWILYNQLCLAGISVKIIQEPKLLGYHNPSSQTPSITREGVRWVMRLFVLFPNYTSIGIKSSSALQGWERWVFLPEMSLGLEGGKREDHASYSPSKVSFNYMAHQDSTFLMKYKKYSNFICSVHESAEFSDLYLPFNCFDSWFSVLYHEEKEEKQ